jgi:hypothetical protein
MTSNAAVKGLLGIAPEYFTDVPADPSRERLLSVRRELHGLLQAAGRNP